MRDDGRNSDQLRKIEMIPDFLDHPAGSVLISCGQTKVLCTASVEAGVPKFRRDSGGGWLTAEYAMLPASTHERSGREVNRGRQGGRTLEIQRLIGRSLRAVTNLDALGERTIILDCDVIQADGGTRTASVNGAFVALGLALLKLRPEIGDDWKPLRSRLAAVSVGIVKGEVLLDLNYPEDSTADVDMNVIMTDKDELVEIQGTAEEHPFSRREMSLMLDLAEKGIAEIIKQSDKDIFQGRLDSLIL
ncbi:MAG: ribonuclease PH [Deltaproteobacteria bacterium]|nr:ribonuclease PH [Candidatus Tharpella sp.]